MPGEVGSQTLSEQVNLVHGEFVWVWLSYETPTSIPFQAFVRYSADRYYKKYGSIFAAFSLIKNK